MKIKERIKQVLCVILSAIICFFAVFCIALRVSKTPTLKNDATLMAVLAVMPDASLKMNENKTEERPTPEKPKSNTQETTTHKEVEKTTKNKDAKTYPISEISINKGNYSYDGLQVNNSTSYDLDAKQLLESELPFEIKDTRQAQVLIVHTHTCESYMDIDEGYYYEDFYPRTTNNKENVTAVGKQIAETLKEEGIGVVHATVQHDNPSYDGAYDRSYDTIMSYLDKYKEIKVVLDIHRDSMTREDMTKLKPTFTYNGEKAAQIMIMTGRNLDGSFETWEQNLTFALKLQKMCETKYPGMTRPLNFGDFTYNMNVNSGSLLIEVGTDANTLEEAKRTGKMLANALAEVLQNE